MGKIERFEDLKFWQAARRMVKEVFLVCEQGKLAKDFETRSQFKQASLSAMNNIAEGFGRYHQKDSLRFYIYLRAQHLKFKVCCMLWLM